MGAEALAVLGRKSVGFSLWPDLRNPRSHLWLIGLGHLGQAYFRAHR
jgi:hypothetical protein